MIGGYLTVAVEDEGLDGVDERVGVLELGRRRGCPRRCHHGPPRRAVHRRRREQPAAPLALPRQREVRRRLRRGWWGGGGGGGGEEGRGRANLEEHRRGRSWRGALFLLSGGVWLAFV